MRNDDTFNYFAKDLAVAMLKDLDEIIKVAHLPYTLRQRGFGRETIEDLREFVNSSELEFWCETIEDLREFVNSSELEFWCELAEIDVAPVRKTLKRHLFTAEIRRDAHRRNNAIYRSARRRLARMEGQDLADLQGESLLTETEKSV